MLSENEFFRDNNSDTVWTRYCGFLDLSLEKFCEIQQRLLLDQITKAADAPLYKELMPNARLRSIEEFRLTVPLSNYKDYTPYLQDDREDMLTEKPHYWVHTSASRGIFKRVPWTHRFHLMQSRNVISALILSAAKESGDVRVTPDCKILNLLPRRPFASACLGFGVIERFSAQLVPPLQSSEGLPFIKKMDTAILSALNDDIDFAFAMTSSLLRTGQRFGQLWNQIKRKPRILFKLHPSVALRLLWSKRDAHAFPKSAWAVKGIITWGADSNALNRTIEEQWGKKPLQLYASSEAGIIAMQDWGRGPMAFLPDSVFLEFIPEEFVNKNDPPTVLIDEVEEGKAYELVITSLYGMPFLRYRQGDLIRIVQNNARGNGVPRLTFLGRADDVIDIFGIARLNTEVVSEALGQIGVSSEDWCLYKEYESGRVVLSLYIELDNGVKVAELYRRLNRALKSVDRHWGEAIYTMGYNPIRVKVLPRGAFRRLSHRYSTDNHRWLHINPPDSMVQELVRFGEEKA